MSPATSVVADTQVLVELVYAVEKATNPLSEDDRQAILEELTRNDTPFEVLPVTAAVADGPFGHSRQISSVRLSCRVGNRDTPS